jgi:hypothetical protein
VDDKFLNKLILRTILNRLVLVQHFANSVVVANKTSSLKFFISCTNCYVILNILILLRITAFIGSRYKAHDEFEIKRVCLLPLDT